MWRNGFSLATIVSEIGIEFWVGSVWKLIGKNANAGLGFKRLAAHPNPFFLGVLPGYQRQYASGCSSSCRALKEAATVHTSSRSIKSISNTNRSSSNIKQDKASQAINCRSSIGKYRIVPAVVAVEAVAALAAADSTSSIHYKEWKPELK